MRLSVIASDIVLFLGILLCVNVLNEMTIHSKDSSQAFAISNGVISGLFIMFNGGLLLVDHVHFQYNGLLLGLLLLSMGSLMKSNNCFTFHRSSVGGLPAEFLWGIFGGMLFAGLLVMKHLYLPLAPVRLMSTTATFVLKTHITFPIDV
jgi:alpha-1,3-glucosyltransferase